MTSGVIFDIKRFAVHDGAGLRTTVFFKGCPLRCRWCHNPEGFEANAEIGYHHQLCIHCLSCIEVCPKQALSLVEDKIVRFQECNTCGVCTKECPTNALAMIGETITVEELIVRLKADQIFYDSSEGGITISGGEPFQQIDFLIELLKACKLANLHTAIETSLYTDYHNIKLVLPFVDQFIVDIKVIDTQLHEKYTGVDNSIILENIRKLVTEEVAILIRTPLIPKITDTEDNLEKIKSFLESLPRKLEHELLNYNPLAASKYELIQKEYTLLDEM